jgi:tripeptide aminopeptidase
MIDRDRLVKTFCELASIDSPSSEEAAIAEHLTGRLKSLGLEVAEDAYGNLIASDGRDNPFMLSAHMDTVEPGRGVKPVVDGDRISSDGTTILGGDCKAGLTAILEALESLQEDGAPHIPIEVVCTREEELALVGARNLDFSMIRSTEAIVFDGEGPPSQITASSPTYIGFDVEITGRAAHAGMEPEKGLSAIRIAAELISSLPNGRLDSETTFNIGTIEAGNVRNSVPENAVLRGEFRSMNLETLDDVRLQLTEALDKVRKAYPEAEVSVHMDTNFETYTLDDDDPATNRVKSALGDLGLKPTMLPSGGGTDGNIFRRKGISAVVVGMADHNMHTVREYVVIPDLVDAAHLCETLLRA